MDRSMTAAMSNPGEKGTAESEVVVLFTMTGPGVVPVLFLPYNGTVPAGRPSTNEGITWMTSRADKSRLCVDIFAWGGNIYGRLRKGLVSLYRYRDSSSYMYVEEQGLGVDLNRPLELPVNPMQSLNSFFNPGIMVYHCPWTCHPSRWILTVSNTHISLTIRAGRIPGPL